MDPLTSLPPEIFEKIIFYVFPKFDLSFLVSLSCVSRGWLMRIYGFPCGLRIRWSFKDSLNTCLPVILPKYRRFIELRLSLPYPTRAFRDPLVLSTFRTSLRSLSLNGPTDDDIGSFVASLSRLESLDLVSSDEPFSGTIIESASSLRSLSNLSHFSFSLQQKKCIDLITHFRHLTSLGVFHLKRADELRSALAAAPNLHKLIIGNMRELNVLPYLPQAASSLTALKVIGCSLEDDEDLYAVATLTSLKKAAFTLALAVDNFALLSNLQSLHTLKLTLSHINTVDLSPLRKLSNLRSLQLSEFGDMRRGIADAQSSSVRTLILKTSHSAFFSPLGLVSSLQRLRLYGFSVGREDWKQLAHRNLFELMWVSESGDLPAELPQYLRSHIPICIIPHHQ